MSPPTIASSILPHCCSNMLFKHPSIRIHHSQSVTCGTSLQPVVALPSFTRRLRRLFGAVHPLPFAGRFTVTFVPFLGIFGQHLGSEVVVFGTGKRYRHGDITGFFPVFCCSPTKNAEKIEDKILVKITSDQQQIWDLYTNLPYQLKSSCWSKSYWHVTFLVLQDTCKLRAPGTSIEGKHHLCFLHDVSPLFCYWSTKSCTTLHTPPKTNMSPRKGPFQKEMIIWTNHQFSENMLVFDWVGVGSLLLTMPTNLH